MTFLKASPGCSVTYWRALPIGGLEMLSPGDASATMIVVKLPTLKGGQATFNLPGDHDIFNAFMIGMSHGYSLGERDQRNDMRRMLGFEVVTDMPMPTIEGPSHVR